MTMRLEKFLNSPFFSKCVYLKIGSKGDLINLPVNINQTILIFLKKTNYCPSLYLSQSC